MYDNVLITDKILECHCCKNPVHWLLWMGKYCQCVHYIDTHVDCCFNDAVTIKVKYQYIQTIDITRMNGANLVVVEMLS